MAAESYRCPCGWSRIVLDGETLADAQRAHEGTAVHKLTLDDNRELRHRAQAWIDADGQTWAVCAVCGRDLDSRTDVGWVHASGRRGLR